MQESNWNQPINISPRFVLQKHLSPLQTFETNLRFDLVYFDAFSPDKQPELWTLDIFQKIFDLMNPGGILVTYSSKGEVKRNLKTSGFIVERLPGPPGKRHMIRAKKI
jgi:tRNA U34 5-methylaminomethyl-2-thiouridine-forming methyltransferase MnmC